MAHYFDRNNNSMLEHLFGSSTRVRLLELFFNNSNRSFFVREMSRLVDIQLNAVRREIENLETIGIIEKISEVEAKKENLGDEKSKFYRLKKDSMLYSELEALVSKVQVLEKQELIEELKNKAGDLKMLLLSGIFTADSDSDVDMLIVGKVKPVAVLKMIKKFEKVMNHEMRYSIMTAQEFEERKEIGDKFLYNIFESNHIMILDKIHLPSDHL